MGPNNEDSSDNQVRSFVEAVCLRPLMYTIGGTIEEIGAFLEGFYSGMASHNRDASATSEAQLWYDFCEWATKTLEATESGNWYILFKGLRRAHDNDSEALVKLASLYAAFRRQYTT